MRAVPAVAFPVHFEEVRLNIPEGAGTLDIVVSKVGGGVVRAGIALKGVAESAKLSSFDTYFFLPNNSNKSPTKNKVHVDLFKEIQSFAWQQEI